MDHTPQTEAVFNSNQICFVIPKISARLWPIAALM
jgi:hypothetical protein